MIFTSNRYKNKKISLIAAVFISLAGFLGLQACSSSSSAVPTGTNPAGYYTGGATVKDANNADLVITDLKGMINGTRFIVYSDILKLVYDGTITSITENDFTADVTIYITKEDVVAVANTTTISGMITEGSQITGTIEGSSTFNGTFSLVFEQTNSTVSDSATLVTAANELWQAVITEDGAAFNYHEIAITSNGVISDVGRIAGGTLIGCASEGQSILPIANSQLFTVLITFNICTDNTINGDYTGLATLVDNKLNMVFSNGTYAVSGEHSIILF